MAPDQEIFAQPNMSEDERTTLYQLALFAKQYERITKDCSRTINSIKGRIRSIAEPYLLRDHPDLKDDKRLTICGEAFDEVLSTYRQRRKDLAKEFGLKTTDVSALALADEVHATLVDEDECMDGIRAAGKWPEQLPLALRDDILVLFGSSLAFVLTMQSDKLRVENRIGKEIRKLSWYDQYLIEFGIKGIEGLSDHFLAVLIGYIRNPSNYPNIDCVVQRMGVGVCNREDGTNTIQGRDADCNRLTGQDAVDDGYCPIRRTVLYHISSNIVKQKRPGKTPSKYLRFYTEYKAKDLKDHPVKVDTGRKSKSGEAIYIYTPMHMNFRALRVTGKLILKDLMVSWWSFYGRVDKNPQSGHRYKAKAA